MTLTKELRRILDERGVKWCESFYPDPRFTRWESNGVAWNACEVGDGILLNSNDPITPEDVIAATVGTGMLTAEQVREAIEQHSAWVIGNNRCFHNGAYEEIADELNATVDRRDTMGLWPEWEQVLFANVSDEVAQDNLNECVHELLDKAATMGERNPDGLPIGLTVSNDGNLLNWVGENYVRQDAATVGRGNLTAEQVREAIMSADRWRKPMGDTGMTNTHLIIRDDGWQAIADELNATVGAGTCRNISKVTDTSGRKVRFVCSECDAWIDSEFIWNHEYSNGESPWVKDCKLNYCPNCGRRIREEAE